MSCTLHNCTVHNCTCIIQYVDLSRAAREEGIPSLFATILYFGAAEHISFLKYKTVYIHIPCCQNIPRVDDQFSCHRIESLQSHDLFVDPGSSGRQTIPVANWDFLWRSSSIHLLYLQQKTFSQNYGSHISILIIMTRIMRRYMNNVFGFKQDWRIHTLCLLHIRCQNKFKSKRSLCLQSRIIIIIIMLLLLFHTI